MAIPLLVMGLISAAAAAAGGIASAAGQADAAKTNANESAKDRILREQMQKKQLAESQRQFEIGQQQSATAGLQNQYAAAAEKTTAQAAERSATRDDLRANLSRAYLQRK